MTRDEFLKNQWTPYPQPSAMYWGAKEWHFGKIAQKTSDRVQFLGSPQLFDIRSQQNTDSVLGRAAPIQVISIGDVVAYHSKTGSLFLLSPNLNAQSPTQRDEALLWQRFLETVRSYFNENDFRYWQTPSLLASPGIDAHIDFFSATGVRTQRTYFLPTSPEFALKKAIADGETKIFEIKSCFRDDDESPTHGAEFFMLEWYRAYADKWELFEDFLNLVRYVVRKMELSFSLDFSASTQSMAELFLQKLNFRLSPQTTSEELRLLLSTHQLHTSPTDDWDDLFFRLYIEFIEPALGQSGPHVVYNFPFSQGSLARKTTEGWADRFEIYWLGIELANAYQEQNDPQAIEARYHSEIEKRVHANKKPHPQDPAFLAKMQQGFPPSAGIALGLDRLWMVLNRRKTLQT